MDDLSGPPLPVTSPTPDLAPTAAAPVARKRPLIIGAAILLVALGAGGWYYFTHYNWRSPEQVLAILRSDLMPSVVKVSCADEEGGEEAWSGSGGYYVDESGTPIVETNAHVVLGSDGQYHGCNVYFPRLDGSFYDAAYVAGNPILYSNVKSVVDGVEVDGIDYAQLPLISSVEGVEGAPFPFPPARSGVYAAIGKTCKQATHVKIGDPIYVIGYPGTGGDSVTLTEGVVSEAGGDTSQLIKVSAGINHGNSGGVAIGADNGCSYGIPTKATFELGSNLGYILGSGYINRFITGLTGQSTYAPPAFDMSAAIDAALSQGYPLPDEASANVRMRYPEGWTVSTSSPEGGNPGDMLVTFLAPLEGALDIFAESADVWVYRDVPKSEFATYVSSLREDADYQDSEHSPGSYITVDGVRTYQIANEDYYSYEVPARNFRALFWHDDTLYYFSSVSEMGAREQDYRALFERMVGTLKFRK